MNHIIYNILIPAIMPILFLNIAATPVEVLGCRNRGLIAFMIALISGLASLGAAIMAIRGRMIKDLDTIRWIITSLILVIPVIALIILA
jgi:hypothetical protein